MTATATSTSSKLSTKDQVAAILAKESKNQVTAPLINSDDVRISNKEVIEQAKAKEQAKPQRTTKPVSKPAAKPIVKPITKPTKAVTKPKAPKEPKTPLFTCSEAMGIIMRQNPKATKEVIINKADTLYIKKMGKESNLFQMGKYYHFATTFLKGYNAK